MEQMSCDEILKATGDILLSGRILSGGKNTFISGISTDSRTVKNGDLFVPIRGERFDGHDFIGSAFDNGAAATLSSNRNIDFENHTVIMVEDTVKAFGKIAAYYRKKFSIPFIAVTGSVGKTATKDMIACVLGQKYNVLKTAGNFNNQIGLPQTIMGLDKQHEAAVLEMGMSGPGEIAILSDIVRPDISVITNIGISHIEKLGSKEDILKAKLEILE
ncbi:MAG: UDP-N-acetylmuramoyl-tripeptide--D-alanyl-D-alanine ligase, partial [Eubacteriales bacterium]|nr:UDP-N-acetylmuramoyl-tripeptide--D-alanyl-D-alanine ligase [Eubacteriales bacterium]